jgi:hypothetical protein
MVDTKTQQDDLISLLLFFINKDRRPNKKMANGERSSGLGCQEIIPK